jgi:imidazolonepropionase-like amidohydrolase
MHRLISVVHAETADEVRTAIDAGATGVEHVASMEALPPSLLTSIASKRPFVDATFGEYRAALALRGTPVKSIEQILSAKRDMIKALADAGARIVVGTDSPLIAYGAGVHNELDELRAAGFGEADLLKAATITNAEYLGRAHDAGRIAAGFLADLILTHENPLVDHRTLRTPTWVMLDGVLVVPPKR